MAVQTKTVHHSMESETRFEAVGTALSGLLFSRQAKKTTSQADDKEQGWQLVEEERVEMMERNTVIDPIRQNALIELRNSLDVVQKYVKNDTEKQTKAQREKEEEQEDLAGHLMAEEFFAEHAPEGLASEELAEAIPDFPAIQAAFVPQIAAMPSVLQQVETLFAVQQLDPDNMAFAVQGANILAAQQSDPALSEQDRQLAEAAYDGFIDSEFVDGLNKDLAALPAGLVPSPAPSVTAQLAAQAMLSSVFDSSTPLAQPGFQPISAPEFITPADKLRGQFQENAFMTYGHLGFDDFYSVTEKVDYSSNPFYINPHLVPPAPNFDTMDFGGGSIASQSAALEGQLPS